MIEIIIGLIFGFFIGFLFACFKLGNLSKKEKQDLTNWAKVWFIKGYQLKEMNEKVQ
jgi:hypothetical protein